MENKSELERVFSYKNLERLPSAGYKFRIHLGHEPDKVHERIMMLVTLIVETDITQWPEDQEWHNKLPAWMLKILPVLSQEQCIEMLETTPRKLWHTLPWEFGSWLMAIHERGWQWWSCKITGAEMRILLLSISIPERIDAFKQILKAAGARLISEGFC